MRAREPEAASPALGAEIGDKRARLVARPSKANKQHRFVERKVSLFQIWQLGWREFGRQLSKG